MIAVEMYVYLQPVEKATIALQYVHTMGRENGDILGLQAMTTGLLFILTNEELTVIKDHSKLNCMFV